MDQPTAAAVDEAGQAVVRRRGTAAGALQRISMRVRPSFVVTGTQRIVRQAGPVAVVATFFIVGSLVDLRKVNGKDVERASVHLLFTPWYPEGEQQVNDSRAWLEFGA